MSIIIIFDLDDTLVNGKMVVPRQTYHMLNKFKKLYIFYENIDRHILFNKCLHP